MPRLFQQRDLCGAFATASVQSATGSRQRDARERHAPTRAPSTRPPAPMSSRLARTTRDIAGEHWQRPSECHRGTYPRQVQRLLRHEVGLGEHRVGRQQRNQRPRNRERQHRAMTTKQVLRHARLIKNNTPAIDAPSWIRESNS